MIQKQTIVILCILLLNIYLKTWKDIPKYYNNLAYTAFINALYNYIFKRHYLWEFLPDKWSWKNLTQIHTLIISPLLVLLYLHTLPREIFNKIIHLILWVFCLVIGEHFIVKKRLLVYKYGWNVLWSGLIYIQMFVFNYLYNKRPLIVWIFSALVTIFYMVKFKLPLTRRFLKGPYFLFFRKTNPSLLERIKTSIYPYCFYLINQTKFKVTAALIEDRTK
ncbi:CBO0543 family protein [Halalkalibacter flavus]|uniref:CBO0543 family protein n=1 Tax=Halalkalibacter flavus TaxID=3090668 RepID=UPI003D66B272